MVERPRPVSGTGSCWFNCRLSHIYESRIGTNDFPPRRSGIKCKHYDCLWQCIVQCDQPSMNPGVPKKPQGNPNLEILNLHSALRPKPATPCKISIGYYRKTSNRPKKKRLYTFRKTSSLHKSWMEGSRGFPEAYDVSFHVLDLHHL